MNDFNYEKRRNESARKIQHVWHDYWYRPNANGVARCAERSYAKISEELGW